MKSFKILSVDLELEHKLLCIVSEQLIFFFHFQSATLTQ